MKPFNCVGCFEDHDLMSMQYSCDILWNAANHGSLHPPLFCKAVFKALGYFISSFRFPKSGWGFGDGRFEPGGCFPWTMLLVPTGHQPVWGRWQDLVALCGLVEARSFGQAGRSFGAMAPRYSRLNQEDRWIHKSSRLETNNKNTKY